MLKAFIVDDEPLARDELAYLLKRSNVVEVVGEAEHLEEAIEKLDDRDVDVLFLDIQLAESSGLELARRIQELPDCPEIVFATAYDMYALHAFELSAADYLLKPFDEERIQKTIAKLLKARESSAQREVSDGVSEPLEKLAINLDGRIVLVNVKDILYLVSAEGRTMIVTNQGKYESNDSLVTFERKLQATPVMRVHRSYLVHLDHIKEIQPWFHSTYNLIMMDKESIPVSRTYTKELKKKIGL
ncbi:LytR/AlgR family response regulator transcription factor [Bacillus sp. 1P06AnD]|uniref:LytR/AlgR family response regulator transcription factor n=1 Tax=Bacillus sp. 1P06AnD TaxID=3132208 RepID=UPI0039A2D177